MYLMVAQGVARERITEAGMEASSPASRIRHSSGVSPDLIVPPTVLSSIPGKVFLVLERRAM